MLLDWVAQLVGCTVIEEVRLVSVERLVTAAELTAADKFVPGPMVDVEPEMVQHSGRIVGIVDTVVVVLPVLILDSSARCQWTVVCWAAPVPLQVYTSEVLVVSVVEVV